MRLLIPDDAPFATTELSGVEVVPYAPSAPLSADQLDVDAAVVWGFAAGNLAQLAGSPRLRWVQTLAAGPDGVMAAGFDPGVIISTGRGFHDRTVTEHAVALILALLRQLPATAAAQAEHRWADELGGFRPLRGPAAVTSLIEARVLIWGFGSIGQTLAPVLAALGATVTGVARSAGERAGFPVITEEALVDELPRTDVLVLVLPHDPATRHALNDERLALLPPTAHVVNVGRGSTVDEAALVAALREGRLAGAALDVTEVEPLPADSPLWEAPRLILTPHLAGGRPLAAGPFIAENLRRFRAGEPLANQVAR